MELIKIIEKRKQITNATIRNKQSGENQRLDCRTNHYAVKCKLKQFYRIFNGEKLITLYNTPS